jgi:hypothetical protein
MDTTLMINRGREEKRGGEERRGEKEGVIIITPLEEQEEGKQGRYRTVSTGPAVVLLMY